MIVWVVRVEGLDNHNSWLIGVYSDAAKAERKIVECTADRLTTYTRSDDVCELDAGGFEYGDGDGSHYIATPLEVDVG